MSSFRPRAGVRYPRVSNRQRQRQAQQATEEARTHILESRKAIALLCAVLGQKGGEITITRGTLDQVTQDMGYQVLPSAENPETELIVRLITGAANHDVASQDTKLTEECGSESAS